MKVEELQRFGASLEMPKEIVKRQGRVMLRALRRRFGILGMLGIFKDTWVNQRRLRRDNPETRRKAAAISEIIETELFTFSAMFLALAKRLGREEAYEFFKTRVLTGPRQRSPGARFHGAPPKHYLPAGAFASSSRARSKCFLASSGLPVSLSACPSLLW